ncbi:EVE domain-containing protein [Pelagibacterales bacterium]|jgi:predicted RNA-binding protein with PUA-like domain|nr:EVE domain-containing protein [Pelagibacterales bacterium]MDB9818146.1 EVE domain-containing protein [Pelagibacterales bacterium]MDB9985445.1 EVE domain-containing protein [Pelagibacterales bacterium]
MKSEPSTWSWEQQIKVGSKGEGWDGVRNYQASNNMKKMKKGDLCFFYHSVKERDIIGIVKVKNEYHPDPTDKSERFGMVTVVAVKPLKNRVNLDQIKEDKRLSHLALVKQSRLSVMPIDVKSWKIICNLGGIK